MLRSSKHLLDVSDAQQIEVAISRDGSELWVNSEEGCLFRAKRTQQPIVVQNDSIGGLIAARDVIAGAAIDPDMLVSERDLFERAIPMIDRALDSIDRRRRT